MGQSHGSAVFFEGLGHDLSRLEAAVRKSLDVDALDFEPDLQLFEHKRFGISALVCVHDGFDEFDLLLDTARAFAVLLKRPTWFFETFAGSADGMSATAFAKTGKQRWAYGYPETADRTILQGIRRRFRSPRKSPDIWELPYWRMVSEWRARPLRPTFELGLKPVLDLGEAGWASRSRWRLAFSPRRAQRLAVQASARAEAARQAEETAQQAREEAEAAEAGLREAERAEAEAELAIERDWNDRLERQTPEVGPVHRIVVPRAIALVAQEVAATFEVPLPWVLQAAMWIGRTWSFHWTHFKAATPTDPETVELMVGPHVERLLRQRIRKPDLRDASFEEAVRLRLLVGIPRLKLELGDASSKLRRAMRRRH